MIYLDNAATTRPSEAAVRAAVQMTEAFGNPSSLHSLGIEAEKAMEKARCELASAMGIEPECLYFTSGGTMSDNIAVRGFLASKRGGRVITSAFEHPAVAECMKNLGPGFEVVSLQPQNGIITAKQVEEAVTPDTVLVSIMQVNNETGAKNEISAIAALLREEKIVFHTDAVQGFMKEPFNYSKVDMASFSAHKNHALKGVGGLYLRKGLRPRPMIYGGGQEGNIQSGTQNLPGICAWAAAVKELSATLPERHEKAEALYARYAEIVSSLGGEILTPGTRSPYVLSVAFSGYLGENLLHFLSEKEIYVSTGSACSSKKGSHVMKAIGRENIGKSVLRLSFCDRNTLEEAEIFASALREALASVKTI